MEWLVVCDNGCASVDDSVYDVKATAFVGVDCIELEKGTACIVCGVSDGHSGRVQHRVGRAGGSNGWRRTSDIKEGIPRSHD